MFDRRFRLLFVALIGCACSGVQGIMVRPAVIVDYPALPDWVIVSRDGTGGRCSARQKEKDGQAITMLASRELGGGLDTLSVRSRNHRLKPDSEAAAQLSLGGKPVATGRVVGGYDNTFVYFEFANLREHAHQFEAGRRVEIVADGLSPLKLGSLSQVMAALKTCQIESSKPGFGGKR